MLDKPPVDDWLAKANRLELRRVGRELSGPCPLCRGVDRFHVLEESADAIVGIYEQG